MTQDKTGQPTLPSHQPIEKKGYIPNQNPPKPPAPQQPAPKPQPEKKSK